MTSTQTHATFVLERTYPVPVEKVWAAFADPVQKKQWFLDEDCADTSGISEDFRIGGHGTNDGDMPDGSRSEFKSTYTDIVENQRIVYTYDMWLNRAHASTSITTIVFETVDGGTRLTFTEQGVHLDGIHGPGPEAAAGREHGTDGLLDQLGSYLSA